jgi:hypothetical protein
LIVVTVDVMVGDEDARAVHVVTIANAGPVHEGEAGDSGGERYYDVRLAATGHGVRIIHARRDGLLPLVAKAVGALT